MKTRGRRLSVSGVDFGDGIGRQVWFRLYRTKRGWQVSVREYRKHRGWSCSLREVAGAVARRAQVRAAEARLGTGQ